MDYSKYSAEFPLPLFGGNKEVGQQFRTRGDLARIDILLANYQIKPKGGTLQLSVFKGNECLFLKKYPAEQVNDNQFYRFVIDTADTIPRGNYMLRLKHSPMGKKERLAVWTRKRDVYPFGDLFVNGRKVRGDMTFRVYYRSTVWQQARKILEMVPSVWLGRIWLILGAILMVFMLNAAVYFFLGRLLIREKK